MSITPQWYVAGLALGINLLGLPWSVHSIMLAGSVDYYTQQQRDLTKAFSIKFLTGAGFLISRIYPVHEYSHVRVYRFIKP